MSITHCIFDLDGLLLDTESIYTECLQKMLTPYGKNFTTDMKVKMMGKSTLEAGQLLIRELELPMTDDEFLVKSNELYIEAFPDAQLMQGVQRLIEYLAKNNIPIAIATGSDEHLFELKTRNHRELFKLFDPIICTNATEVRKTKPEPDIFLEAARKFKQPPLSMSQCLVFEDAENGVQAALAAEMKVVLVPSLPLAAYSSNLVKQATVVLDKLTNFDPEMFGLPPMPPSSAS
ncbi:unnamed protein product [Didymodactylos carnosus]|uniref:pseudouridine 5'-phosphatase n=1 Tax=Didymodactylos carnosus TaxID=1234261 RepID=A0A814R6W4_9BILA|nr:unnamed protein product [Didymodactylos carnosus]CAF1172088.1 unnamed protein product [Didymodactylos carnosus]CAF3891476.1 unnamed protein product [Didymodactylos carnosus]CAF3983391.1 unnamed protein product [Didymodactylos carnosus]